MYSNSGPWFGFPTQYTGYPSYYPGVPHTTSTTNIPHPVPNASDPGSSSTSTRLTAGAKEFVPAGTVGPGPVDPSPGFPLPKKKAIRISNPVTGEEITLRSPTRTASASAAPDVYVSKPIRIEPDRGQSSHTKKAKKRLAKLEAEEQKCRKDEERRFRMEAVGEAIEAKMKARKDERLKKAREEKERRKREKEEKLEREEEERRRKIEEDSQIQPEKLKEEQERKQREEAADHTGSASAARDVYVSKPIQIRPDPSGHGTITKKERKRLAKLKAEEETRFRMEAVGKAIEAKMKARKDERLKKAREEEERRKREEEEKLETEEDEQERKQREEAQAEAKAEKEERLRRLAEEVDEKFAAEVKEIRKMKEASRLFSFGSPTASTSSSATPSPPPQIPGGFGFSSTQRPLITSSLSRDWALVSRIVDLSRVTYPEGINPPSAELDNGQMPGGKYKHVYDRDFLLQFTPICKEKPDYASNLDGLGVKRQERLFVRDNPLYEPSGHKKGRRGRGMGAMGGPSSPGVDVGRDLTGLPGRNPFLPPNSEGRFKASTSQLEGTASFQSASSNPRTQDTQGHPLNHDPSTALAGPKDQNALQLNVHDLAEGKESTKRAAMDVRNGHVTINAISELSKQMEQLLREMKDLKDEVRELRSLTRREDKKERGESPYRESSAPQAKPRTATAVNPYFIMKEGELDFVQGDLITLLDPPQDTPSPRGSGWLYGEINVTKRGFFPASYVKLQK